MAEAKLAQCPRCKAATLVAERQGIRIAIDIAPVDALGYGIAVASGVGLWWAENTPGRPSRVLGRRSATQNPSWGSNGSQAGSQRLHAEHSCGASARDQVILNVQAPSGGTVCDQWRATGWTPSRKCPRQMGQTQIKSCHQCEPPPFDQGPPCYDGVKTGGSQDGQDDQIREGRGPNGAGTHGPGGRGPAGGPLAVDRQPWLPAALGGGSGAPAAPLAARVGDRQPPGGGPHQPLNPGQPAQQPASGHPGGVQPQSRREDLALGAGRQDSEVGPYGGHGQAQPGGVPPGDLRLGGGGAGGQGGIPGGPSHQGAGPRNVAARPAQPLRQRGEVPGMHPAPPTRPTRCGICDKMIVAGQSWWGFEHATTVYAEHEECP